MPDLLSMTSLAVTLCNGLLKAIDSWRSYDGDLQKAGRQIEVLAETLDTVKDVLDGPKPASRSKILVEDSVDECSKLINKLQEETKKLRGQTAAGDKKKARKVVQHAAYPLTRTTLEKIRSLVEEVQQRLGLTLQILERYVL